MLKFLMIIFSLSLFTSEGFARAVKLGQKGMQQNKVKSASVVSAGTVSVSCFENEDCPYDKECIALQCVDVCKNSVCLDGTYCAPAGKDKPHQYQCAECVVNFHCPDGMFCDRDYKCKYPDPCRDAVCSPAAPFCLPKPYQTLPYTCVQCTQDDHCPPVAGLTRRCVDGYCLFNIEGNIPKQATQETVQEQQSVQEQQPVQEQPSAEEYYDEDLYPYEDEYEDMSY